MGCIFQCVFVKQQFFCTGLRMVEMQRLWRLVKWRPTHSCSLVSALIPFINLLVNFNIRTHTPINPSIHLSIHTSNKHTNKIIHQPEKPCIHQIFHPSNKPTTYPDIKKSIHPSYNPPIYSFIHPLKPSIKQTIHESIHSSNKPTTYPAKKKNPSILQIKHPSIQQPIGRMDGRSVCPSNKPSIRPSSHQTNHPF